MEQYFAVVEKLDAMIEYSIKLDSIPTDSDNSYIKLSNNDIEKIDRLLGRLCVVDGQEFVLGLTDDTKIHPTQDVAFWTKSDHVVTNFLEPMFDLIWHNSKPVK